MTRTEYRVYQTDGCTPEDTADAPRREVACFEGFADAREWARSNLPRHRGKLVPQRGRFLQIRDLADGLIWESWCYVVVGRDTFSRERYGWRAFRDLGDARKEAEARGAEPHGGSDGLRDTVALYSRDGHVIWETTRPPRRQTDGESTR